MDAKQDKIILSIGLLVSNRKDTIQKCLDSLKPIREAVPCQLIITDTGCDADLRKMLEEYADVISDFVWCDDFAKARNENLSHATGEWYMYLDDDEWFVDTRDLIDFFVSGEYKKCEGACYIQRNYQNMCGSMFSDDYVSRMVRLTPEHHFVSKIHEYLVPIPQNNYILKSYVDHYGYVFQNEEDIQKHYERNSKLLLHMIEEEPDNQRWWTHLAQEYILVRDFDKLRQLGEDGLALVDRFDTEESVSNRGTFYMCRIVSYECEHKDEKVYEVCEAALADKRNTLLCMAFTQWWKAHSCLKLGKYSEAESCVLEYFKLYQYFLNHEGEFVLQKLALIVGQCYDDVKRKEAYAMLIVAGLKQKQTRYLSQHLRDLRWEEENPYIYELIMDAILEAFATMKEKKLFIRTIRTIHSNVMIWERFCQELLAWHNNKKPELEKALAFCAAAGYGQEIQCILEWDKVETALTEGIPADSYPEYKTWLVAFSENVIGFYKGAYGKNFDKQQALPSVCLFAMMIQEAMECEADKEHFLEILKQCPALYPRLASAIKKLLALYLQEPQRKEREAREEMRKLKEQVLTQAQTMVAAGQLQEASMIIQQLKAIAPNDLEVAALSLEVRLKLLGA